MRKILISVADGQTRVALLEAGRLAELHLDKGETGQLVGSIYRGRVVDVLPSMQASFLDIGLTKNAFLYIDDALTSDWQQGKKNPSKPNIRELVRVGEDRFVQVTKEAAGTKAPRVTTQLSLPGRILVYMPEGGQIAVSRRIRDERERQRLQEIAAKLLSVGEGVILRTLAEGVDEQRVAAELDYLRSVWREAVEKTKGQKPPCIVYEDTDVVMRVIRDGFSAEVDELVIDHGPTHQRVKQVLTALYFDLLDRLTFYQGKQELFQLYGVEAEIDKALRRQVWLKSGGYLVIDRTEAMTVIDVNTGKYIGKGSQQLEETVTQTNLEAAKEIAHQLRVRDIGGIVIIDFIDMKIRENQSRVLQLLETELAKDRTASHVLGMTQLGLVEMTRKKTRQSLSETLTQPCPVCDGRGGVLAVEEVVMRFAREVRSLSKAGDPEAVVALLPKQVALIVQADTGRLLEVECSLRILVAMDETLHPAEYRLVYVGSGDEAERRFHSIQKALLD